MSALKNRQGHADVLQAYSMLAFAKGAYSAAAILFFAATSLRTKIGARTPPSEQKELDELLASLSDRLSPADLEQAKARGSIIPVKEALESASAV
jgi:hypothetical protein